MMVVLLIILIATFLIIRLASRRSVLKVYINAPSQVKLGANCILDLLIHNTLTKSVVLYSVSVEDSLMKHFEFLGLLPNAIGTSHALGCIAWSYERLLNSGGSLAIQIHLKAVLIGCARGDVSAIDSRLITVSVNPNIQILEAD
jgi:hypothetical protein